MKEWIITNEVLLCTCTSILSFVVTTILTFIIIRQTYKIAKKQSIQELEINKQQEELQKRQIRLNTFEYKNKIYYALHKVFQMTGEIQTLYPVMKLDDKDMRELYEIFSSFINVLKIDVSEFLWLFKQAEYILPNNIVPSVNEISKKFDKLTGAIHKLNLFPDILTQEEMVIEKRKILDEIYSSVKYINEYVQFINSIMPRELDISYIER